MLSSILYSRTSAVKAYGKPGSLNVRSHGGQLPGQFRSSEGGFTSAVGEAYEPD